MRHDKIKILGFTSALFPAVLVTAGLVGAMINQAMRVTPPEQEDALKDWKLYASSFFTATVANAIFVTADNIYEAVKEKAHEIKGPNWKDKLFMALKFGGAGTMMFTMFTAAGIALHQLIEKQSPEQSKDIIESAANVGLASIVTIALAALMAGIGMPMPAETIAQFLAGTSSSSVTKTLTRRHIADPNLQLLYVALATAGAVFLAGLTVLVGRSAISKHHEKLFFRPVNSTESAEADTDNEQPLLPTGSPSVTCL